MKFVCAILFSLVVCIAADEEVKPFKEGQQCNEMFAQKFGAAFNDCSAADVSKFMGQVKQYFGKTALYQDNPLIARFRRDADGDSDQKEKEKFDWKENAKQRMECMKNNVSVSSDPEYKRIESFCQTTCENNATVIDRCIHRNCMACTGTNEKVAKQLKEVMKNHKEKGVVSFISLNKGQQETAPEV